ncbi:MAG: hypothetical protein ACPGFC_08100, partial [Paracoccaceae bacterium]
MMRFGVLVNGLDARSRAGTLTQAKQSAKPPAHHRLSRMVRDEKRAGTAPRPQQAYASATCQSHG